MATTWSFSGRNARGADRLRRTLSAAIAAAGIAALSACSRAPSAAGRSAFSHYRSSDCRACHAAVFAAWAGSRHALAHRPVGDADRAAFEPARDLSIDGLSHRLDWAKGAPQFTDRRPGSPDDRYSARFVIGYSPLRQYVVPAEDGRYQAAELAYDPAKNQWFDVFGKEGRHPGEWGYWRGRGMNWNSMCAACHLTDFHKNYSADTDRYASAWVEHGVGCWQCHGDLESDHGGARRAPAPESVAAARKREQETCAPCHARNELLTGEIRPGAAYADLYRLTLPTDPAVFYPDGQMRDEDFNWTSFLTSRMGGKAGVTCLDCHDPHSGRTVLPAGDNSLCLQCHGPSRRLGAPQIDPAAHSHHAAGSAGNRCVACHMPTTVYMQRDPRHDHGFLRPDPLLTKELGIPNACNRCHADRTVDWAVQAADRWYGGALDSRQRERARAVASAQSAAPGTADRLLALLRTEDIPAWKAALLLLARPYAGTDGAVIAAGRSALGDPDPLVRSSAAQLLREVPGETAALRPLLRDPARLVRLDAEWALSTELVDGSPERRELDAYLAVNADQPTGELRIGEDLFNRGRAADAEGPLRKAVAWDPYSPSGYDALGTVLGALGRAAEAADAFWKAAGLGPSDPSPAYDAGLAFAEAETLAQAEAALRETVRRDPKHDRAWYNLGLLLAKTGRAAEAEADLKTAESLAPREADYYYAEATILAQEGDRQGAAQAARRALEIAPGHEAARSLLDTLQQ